MLQIEETNDGVKLTIPVETTAPNMMKEWKHLEQMNDNNNSNSNNRLETTATATKTKHNMALATSVRTDDDDDDDNTSNNTSNNNKKRIQNPLTIELKCRKCETTGPEAGARAFLMGPEPLSIILCHNRIHSNIDEIQEILTHELIHLYDVQTLQLDLSDCETVAYSEVRAAREAECTDLDAILQSSTSSTSTSKNFVQELTSTLEQHVYKPYCVRSIALGATRNMFPSEGTRCLNKVWETAYHDHRPFPPARNQNAPPTTTTRQQNNDDNDNDNDNDSGTIHGTSGK